MFDFQGYTSRVVPRPDLNRRINTALRHNPVVTLLGPRQCGKTTMARLLAAEIDHELYDLEDPADLARLSAPMLALEDSTGLVIIDEVQRKPELFEILRVLVDRPGCAAKFLLLGSASPHLVRGVSESLAGRVALIEMSGFDVREIGPAHFKQLWMRGGFPRSYLADDASVSYRWRADFVQTFLQRDVPQLGISIPSEHLRRFWTMIAHYHGQVFNAAEFAQALGKSATTVRRYLDLLAGAYVIRQLPPWHENLKKRQVKSPKVYVRDSGLLHSLLSLQTAQAVAGHPKYGASWEGFAMEQVLTLTGARQAYFWATHGGAELDLLIFRDGRRIGFEFKCIDAPRMTRSLLIATDDLDLDEAFVVYPGRKTYAIDPRTKALSILDLASVDGEP